MSELPPVLSLGVAAPGHAALFELDDRAPNPGEVRVETLYSGLSAGTELTFFKGTNPYLHARWDAELGLFREGEPSRTFPVEVMGYMEVAWVVDSTVPSVRAGDLLGMNYGHKTLHTTRLDAGAAVPLPADIDPLLGIYAAQMGPICANGLLHAAAETARGRVRELGDGVRGRRVLVTGGGVVGLLTGLFCRMHGADAVAVADTSALRLAAAEGLGLTPVDEREIPAWHYCKRDWSDGSDRGADVVFQCRGQAATLHTALRSLRAQGVVIDLAFYQGGADALRLGEEFHHNGLTIRCAQIGRVPRGLAGDWDRRRLADETIALVRDAGEAIREHVITDVVDLDDGPALIGQLARREREVVQAVFRMEAAP